MEGERIADQRGQDGFSIRARARQLERPGRVPDRFLDEPRKEPGIAGGRVELRLLDRIGRDLERLLEEPRGLQERAERPGTFRRAAQRHAGLRGDRSPLRPVGLRLVRRNVVLGQRAGDPVIVERLEVARRRDVQPPPVAPRERPVRHLAHEAPGRTRTGPVRATGDPPRG